MRKIAQGLLCIVGLAAVALQLSLIDRERRDLENEKVLHDLEVGRLAEECALIEAEHRIVRLETLDASLSQDVRDRLGSWKELRARLAVVDERLARYLREHPPETDAIRMGR